MISKTDVKQLAEADESECVRELSEFYADFVPLAPHLFSLQLPAGGVYQSLGLCAAALRRCVQGLCALLLALRRQPAIRFQANSQAAKALADALALQLNKEGALFQFGRAPADAALPLLLILDRRDDPLTPLLNQVRHVWLCFFLVQVAVHGPL